VKGQIRLGTLYRKIILSQLTENKNHGGLRVLDVGCHDGYILSTLDWPVKVGVDLEPLPGITGVNLVRCDGRFPPFQKGCFDQIFAMDVIEHVLDDRSFAQALLDLLAPGGSLLVTTPSRDIRLFPPFLTRWVSHQWGHDYRLGYTCDELEALFSQTGISIKIYSWRAAAYRTLYLLMRALYPIWPAASREMLDWVSKWDEKHHKGTHGYLFLEAVRQKPLQEPN